MLEIEDLEEFNIKTLVIGYGNTLMGDDGFGIRVVEELQKRVTKKNIEFILTYQLTPELSIEIKEVDRVIFIDASYGEPNFTIASPLLNDITSSSITHHLNPKVLITTTNELFNVNIEFYIYSVLCREFKMQEVLSEGIKEPFEKILNWLEREL